jgi:uncharacterized membrane protein YjjB (DUF3815 family)
MNLATLVRQTLCGAVAASGFGILFNVRFRMLSWCAASGALALAVRTVCLECGSSLEGASFLAALVVGTAVECLRGRTSFSQHALDVVGCIPMVPGTFAAKAILGLIAVTTERVADQSATLLTAIQYTLRVMFTIGAIGTGLAIPTLLLRVRTPRFAPKS